MAEYPLRCGSCWIDYRKVEGLMPKKSPRQCIEIGCPNLSYESYCDVHKTVRHKEYKKFRSDEKEQAFYKSSAWIRLRNAKRQTDPLCEDCLLEDKLTPMDVCDHMIELKDDWSLRLTMSNIRSLCHSCHNKKTRKVQKLRGE